MSWYEYQPFRWVLENLTAKQIVNLIVGIFVILVLVGSYHVYLDTIRTIKIPEFLWFSKNFILLALIILVFMVIFTLEFKMGLEIFPK